MVVLPMTVYIYLAHEHNHNVIILTYTTGSFHLWALGQDEMFLTNLHVQVSHTSASLVNLGCTCSKTYLLWAINQGHLL